MSIGAAMLSSESQRVGLANFITQWLSHRVGTYVQCICRHWNSLKRQMSRVFAPPNQGYRVLSRFLSSRQGKKELSDCVQELKTLLAAMQLDPLPEAVQVTNFMEGLRTEVARTEVFHVHTSISKRL